MAVWHERVSFRFFATEGRDFFSLRHRTNWNESDMSFIEGNGRLRDFYAAIHHLWLLPLPDNPDKNRDSFNLRVSNIQTHQNLTTKQLTPSPISSYSGWGTKYKFFNNLNNPRNMILRLNNRRSIYWLANEIF